jgi:hypothetical protein
MANQPITITRLVDENHLGSAGMTENLQAELTKNGIESLEQVRRQGGITNLAELSPEEQQVAQRIEAHADFNLISDDLQVNDQLIDAGLHSTAEIGRLPKHQFLKQAQAAGIEAQTAEMIQAKSVAVSAYLANVVTEARVAEANQRALAPILQGNRAALFSDETEYDDRATAVSPLAYLACLLEYTKAHVVDGNGNAIDETTLEGAFHQPLSRFLDKAGEDFLHLDAVDRKIRQIRICIEILRSYGPTLIKPYLLEAYKTLLNQVGASYEDFRLIKNAKSKERQRLAERIGISLKHLDQLYLSFERRTLNEENLERFFGLTDTSRDPISNGLKLIDHHDQIIEWKFNGIQWNKNTDIDGKIWGWIKADPNNSDILIISLYRDNSEEEVIAQCEFNKTEDDVLYFEGSGLSGSFKINFQEDFPFVFSVIPELLCWRLQHLRYLWQNQDSLNDPYSRGELPIIDPDLIGPDDFRNPLAQAEASNKSPFSVWKNRQEKIFRKLLSLKQELEDGNLNLDSFLKFKLDTSISRLENINQCLSDGKLLGQVEKQLQQLHLSVSGFIRLMELRDKHFSSNESGHDSVSDEEWFELSYILVQVWKEKQYPAWIEEEREFEIELSPRYFWPALREPQEGICSPYFYLKPRSYEESFYPKLYSLIDPDVWSLNDLPDEPFGETALILWHQRRVQLQQIFEENRKRTELLTSDLTEDRFNQVIQGSYISLEKIQEYEQKLNSNDSSQVEEAKLVIGGRFCLTMEEFFQLAELCMKVVNNESSSLNSEEADYLAQLLTYTRKRATTNRTDWTREENKLGLKNTWNKFKATLPPWRASQDARQQWKSALRKRSQPPIIDPVIITSSDVKPDINTKPALLLGERQEELDTLTSVLRSEASNAPSWRAWNTGVTELRRSLAKNLPSN